MLTKDDKQRVHWITELGVFALSDPKHFDDCVLAMQHLARGGSDPHHLIAASHRLWRRRQRQHATRQPERTAFAQ